MNHRLLIILTLLTSFAAASPRELLDKPDDWFRSAEGKTVVANVLSWQSLSGSWPKNQDNAKKPFTGEKKKTGTFDNGSTTDELRFLSRAFRATGHVQCRNAVLLGYDHILSAQFPNGGWPQYYPLSKQYHRHITFNDNSMIRLMEFLRESFSEDIYQFLGEDRRSAGKKAFERGLDCIIKCQVEIDGKPTVWCAQHDEITLKPTNARSYELASLSGSESAGILRFLMSIKDPSPAVIRAVKGGVAWYEQAKVKGIRIEKIQGVRTAVQDPAAPVSWARFYDLETGMPFFCDRDGIKVADYNKIGKERRNGYAWYGNWGQSVLNAYAKWPHR